MLNAEQLSERMSRWFVPAAVAIALLMAVGVLKAKSDAAALRQTVEAQERDVARKRDVARALKAEVQFLENPARVEALARRELGMAPAPAEQQARLDAAEPAAP